jgi:NAD(P)-dependent dehydrogenase (short-subunit alcohol dehydrogenase family)
MRVVIVNHMHHSVPHVSGMRAWHFARGLADRGHQVVVLCEWTEGAEPAPNAGEIGARLAVHDWKTPLVLAVRPASVAALDRVRNTGTGGLQRKALVVWSYVRRSGMFTDFSEGAAPCLPPLADAFRPDVVWGIFGNTDCWLLAQRLARLARCGWVGDMKDAWDFGIPTGLRTLVARRFADQAASTANSRFNADVLQRWFSSRPAVVYSGANEDWIRASSGPPEGFPVMLVGAVYDRRNLARLARGLAQWAQSVPAVERHQVSVCYAGSDAASVESAFAELAALVRVDIRGHVPLAELAGLCQGAAANVYLRSDATFHHKLIELLCCRRPIISFPGERAESVELSQQVGGSLNVCQDERQLMDVLTQIRAGRLQPTGGPERLGSLTWASQAGVLEATLQRVATERPACTP